ncbi:MAG: SDR family oxidoreductase [bacterium]
MNSIDKLMSLNGRVAVVTGGAGYIGSALCEALGEVGAKVCILDVDKEKADKLSSDMISKRGIDSLPVGIDLFDEDQIRKVPDIVLKQYHRMDIIVNCAALVGTSELKGWTTPFEEQSSGTWRKALEINLTAAFVLIQASLPALRKNSKGSIINISSQHGMVGPDMRFYEDTQMGNPAAYAVSKGGLIQFTRWLATVLAPEIRVNAISPGGIERNQPEIFKKRYVNQTPLKRMATEEDIKGAAVYLASDLSSYVTGQNIVIDGGFTSW